MALSSAERQRRYRERKKARAVGKDALGEAWLRKETARCELMEQQYRDRAATLVNHEKMRRDWARLVKIVTRHANVFPAAVAPAAVAVARQYGDHGAASAVECLLADRVRDLLETVSARELYECPMQSN